MISISLAYGECLSCDTIDFSVHKVFKSGLKFVILEKPTDKMVQGEVLRS